MPFCLLYKKLFLFILLVTTINTFAQQVDKVIDPVEWMNPLMGSDSKFSLYNSNTYPAIAVPLFDKVKWETSTGEMLKIIKSGKSRNLTSIKVNNRDNKSYFVSHDFFKDGSVINRLTK